MIEYLNIYISIIPGLWLLHLPLQRRLAYGGASRTRGTPSSGVNIQHPGLCQITHYWRHRQHTRRPSPRCTMHDAHDVPSTEHMHYAMYVSTHVIASSQMLRRRRSAVSLFPPCAAPPGLLRKLSEWDVGFLEESYSVVHRVAAHWFMDVLWLGFMLRATAYSLSEYTLPLYQNVLQPDI